MRRYNLALLLVAFFGLATFYGAVIPLGEGPDEPGHAAYVFFLAREGRLPVQRAEPHLSDVPGEGHQPPLAYALAMPAVLWLPHEERRFDLPGNPRFTWAGGDEMNAVAHGSREYLPWRGMALAWHLARLVSAVLGTATVVLTYLAAGGPHPSTTLRAGPPAPSPAAAGEGGGDGPHPPSPSPAAAGEGEQGGYRAAAAGEGGGNGHFSRSIPLLAAAIVAFNPQFLFTSGLITNDALLTTLCAALLWLVIRGQRSEVKGLGSGYRHAIVVGVVLGLALLTKQSAFILAPVALLGLVAREGDETRQAASDRVRITLARWGLATGVAALIAGWWYARNWRLYGDPLGVAAFRAEFAGQSFELANLDAWTGALSQLHASFWARFGWMNVPAPGWVIWFFVALEALAASGLLLLLTRGVRQAVGHWSLVALPALAFGWVFAFALTAGLVAWQGRLLFPALPAIAILLARGLAAWERRETRDERHETRDTRREPGTKTVKVAVGISVLCSLFFVLACALGSFWRDRPGVSLPYAA